MQFKYWNNSPQILSLMTSGGFSVDKLRPLIILGKPGTGRNQLVKTILHIHLCEKSDHPSFKEFFTNLPNIWKCECPQCEKLDRELHPDVFKIDGNLGVQELREFLDNFVSKYPTYNPYKFLILNNLDTYSSQMLDVLLKLVEEPEDNVKVIMIASNKEFIRPAILSRSFLIEQNAFDPVTLREVVKSSPKTQTMLKLLDDFHFNSLFDVKIYYQYRIKDFVENLLFHKNWATYFDLDKAIKQFMDQLPTDYTRKFVLEFLVNYVFFILNDYMKECRNILLLNLRKKILQTFNDSLAKYVRLNNVTAYINVENQIKALFYILSSLEKQGKGK